MNNSTATSNAAMSSLRWLLAILLLGCFAISAWAESAFKITFSAERRSHGRVWNGGVEDAERLRSMLGWHLHDDDRLRPPNRWDIVTQSVGGDVAAPGVILSLNGPDSVPFRFFTRLGDTTFVPSDLPYGIGWRGCRTGRCNARATTWMAPIRSCSRAARTDASGPSQNPSRHWETTSGSRWRRTAKAGSGVCTGSRRS